MNKRISRVQNLWHHEYRLPGSRWSACKQLHCDRSDLGTNGTLWGSCDVRRCRCRARSMRVDVNWMVACNVCSYTQKSYPISVRPTRQSSSQYTWPRDQQTRVQWTGYNSSNISWLPNFRYLTRSVLASTCCAINTWQIKYPPVLMPLKSGICQVWILQFQI